MLFSYRSSLKMQTVNQRGWALPPPCFGGSGHGVLAGQRGITHRGTGKEMQQWGRRMHTGKGMHTGADGKQHPPWRAVPRAETWHKPGTYPTCKDPDVQPSFLTVFIFYLFFCSPWLISPENHAANSILLFFLPVQLLPPPPLGIVVAFLELSGGLFLAWSTKINHKGCCCYE